MIPIGRPPRRADALHQQFELDLKFMVQLHISGIAEAQKPQFGHPISTVVINNSATDVEWFGFHPIEWLRGMVSSNRLPVAGLATGLAVAGTLAILGKWRKDWIDRTGTFRRTLAGVLLPRMTW